MSRISIAIPAWNAERHLRECLQSCLGQDGGDVEVVCVDDGSTDGTARVLDEFAAADDRVKAIHLPMNKGTHMARKAAVLAATGHYVLPLDADDTLDSRACHLLWESSQEGRLDFVLYGICSQLPEQASDRLRSWADRLSSVCRVAADDIGGMDYLKAAFVEESVPIFPAGKMFRRASLQAAFSRIPDGRCIGPEDGLMLAAFMSRDVCGRSITDRLYRYRMGEGISTSDELSFEQRRRWLSGGAFCQWALRTLDLDDAMIERGVRRCLVDRPLDIAMNGLSRRARLALALSCAADIPLCAAGPIARRLVRRRERMSFFLNALLKRLT